MEYDENGVPKRLDAVVLSTQHDPEVTQERIHMGGGTGKFLFVGVMASALV